MSKSYLSYLPKMTNNVSKAVLAGVYSYALDKYVMGEKLESRSLTFGAVVAGGMLFEESLGMLIKPVLPLPNFIPKNSVVSGKKLVDRIAETLSTTASVFLVNKYLLRNDIYKGEVLMRMGIIATADLASVMTLDLVNTTNKYI